MELIDNMWTENSSTRRIDDYVVSCLQTIESVWESGVGSVVLLAFRGACHVSIRTRINNQRIKGAVKTILDCI